MKGFIQQGDEIHHVSYDETSLQATLPPKIYTLEFNPLRAIYFLNVVEARYSIPQTFGDLDKRITRVFRAFKARERSTGALFTGDKGSGKTLFAKVIANKAIDQGLPVIVISRPYYGNAFNEFINAVGECILIFDEIAKTYRRSSSSSDDVDASEQSEQRTLLSFLDGLSSNTRRLLIFTENREYDIDALLLNRPGRILFHYRFSKLSEEEITEMCDVQLDNKTLVKDIIDISRFMTTFSYDILSSIIEEANRNPELEIQEIVEDMNVDYSTLTSNIQYSVTKMLIDNIEAIPNQPIYAFNDYVRGRCKKKDYLQALGRLDAVERADFDEEEITSFGFYISADTMFYEDANTAVFKHDNMTVVTQKIPKLDVDFRQYLM